MRKLIAMAVLVTGLSAGPASAWFNKGHMEIAAIAYPLLDREVRSKVDALIRVNPDYPAWIAATPDPKDQSLAAFVHAATWADAIKKPEASYTNDGEDATVAGALLTIGYADRRTHRYWQIPLKKSAGVAERWRFGSAASGGFRASRRSWRGHWDQFREFAEVLGCCCEMELVTRAIGTSQSQAIELQDALEVGEQHLDLLALAT